MLSIFELADNYPFGFWLCEKCEHILWNCDAEADGLSLVEPNIQPIRDLNAQHCTRCGYAGGTLEPYMLEYF